MQSKSILISLLIFQLVTLISVGFDVPVARQIFSFIFITFVPGFLILNFFKIGDQRFYFTIFLSVGLSIAFLMFVGLILNTLFPIVGLPNPLSAFPIVLSVSLFVTAACVVQWRKFVSSYTLGPMPSIKSLPAIILFVSIPFVTVIGAELAQITGNTLILMLLVVLTSLILVCAFWNKLIPEKIYPLALLAIALFLLFHTSLMTNFIIGTDIHLETYFAQITLQNSHWDKSFFSPYNAMISITILPVIYSNFMNIDITWVFKVAYPLIYALVPLILFFAYRKQTSSLVAFLAVFFFMSMDTFYVQILGLARQMIGELFLALLILLMLNQTINITKKKFLFSVFSFALILSHYSLAYLFLFLCIIAYSISSYFKVNDNKPTDKIVTGKFILGYSATVFIWYVFVAPASSKSLADALGYVYNALISEVSGPGISGLIPSAFSPLRLINQYSFYLLQLFVVVGVIALIVRRKKSQFNPEYASMSIGSLLILFMSIFLPNFAASLNISRFYHLSLFLLAPFCIVGEISIAELFMKIRLKGNFISKRFEKISANKLWKAWIFIAAVLLIILFLFQVGFVYKLSGDNPISISLSRNGDFSRWSTYMYLLSADGREVVACEWLSQYANNGSIVYADGISQFYVRSYGLINPEHQGILYPGAQYVAMKNSYFFFGRLAVENDTILGNDGTWNMTDFSLILDNNDKIYSNGASDIFSKNK